MAKLIQKWEDSRGGLYDSAEEADFEDLVRELCDVIGEDNYCRDFDTEQAARNVLAHYSLTRKAAIE